MAIPFSITDLLGGYGPARKYTTPSGNELVVLPTCRVPLEHLFEENWSAREKGINHGNFRRVRHITTLEGGSKTGLYVKSPEVRFTTSLPLLERDYYWWGGSRSGEKAVLIMDNPLIWEQSEWEALLLLGLYSALIPAEVPYALLLHPNGRKELITGDVEKAGNVHRAFPARTYPQLEKAIDDNRFDKEDFTGHNLIKPEDGPLTIIDVNRWRWPPYTDDFDQRILNLVRERAAH